MKMSLRDWIRGLSVATLATVGLSSVTQAAPTFPGWTVTDGTITIDQSSGYCNTVSCTELVTGKGFGQYEVTDGATVYVYTLITEDNATGDSSANPPSFYDESFIQRGNNTTGIMAHQHSADLTVDSFAGDTKINTGWAVVAGQANLDIMQSFYNQGNTSVTGDEFASAFHLLEKLAADGTVTGKKMSVRQDAGLGDGTKSNDTDRQSFAIEQRSGDYTTTTDGNSLTFQTATGPSTLVWQDGDDVMVSWIGQQVNVADAGATDLSKFGYEGLVNKTLTTTPNSISTFSTTEPSISDGSGGINAPYDWNTLFGAAPELQIGIGEIILP